jgi:hypothetical protein
MLNPAKQIIEEALSFRNLTAVRNFEYMSSEFPDICGLFERQSALGLPHSAVGHAYRLPTLPVAAPPPHPHHPHWRPPSRCTPHPRPPSFPHTFTTLPPPTHRPTPPRRRLTAPIPPDSATGPALALPSLRRLVPPPSFHAHPHRAVPPHRHLFRPLRRPPSRPESKCRSITRPSLPRPISPVPSCVQYLSLLWGSSYYVGS